MYVVTVIDSHGNDCGAIVADTQEECDRRVWDFVAELSASTHISVVGDPSIGFIVSMSCPDHGIEDMLIEKRMWFDPMAHPSNWN